MLEAGFKVSRKFSKRLHLWDFLERIQEQLTTELEGVSADSARAEPLYHRPSDGGVCTAYQEADCKELFHMAVTRINANNHNIGRDEKVWLLCVPF